MSQEHPGDTPGSEPPRPPAERPAGGITEGGYAYTLLDDEAAPGETRPPRPQRRPARRLSLPVAALAALIVVPALVAGVAAWFIAGALDGGGGSDDRLSRNVTNVVNAFSQTDDAERVIRYEGSLPPAFPDDIPLYPGGKVISSIVQVRGNDAGYIVVFDTSNSREDVAAWFSGALAKDPWQIEIEQVGRESTVQQFSNIEDPDVQGVVLEAESKGDDVTTIFMSIQVVGAAGDNAAETYDPGDGRPLPDGFPADAIPQYPGSTVIESGYQRDASARTFVVSMVTKDDPTTVLQHYRDQFQSQQWTVTDAPAGSSQLPDGEAITFSGTDGTTSGSVEAGQLAEDKNFTRINVQVLATD